MATRLIQPTLVHSVTYVTESHCWTLTCHLLYNLHCWELYIVSLYYSNRRQYDPPNSNLETSIFFPRPIRLRISRATIYFLFPFFLRHFCLTKAYNLCHQVALVDRPMRREVAIRWTNRKRAASSLGKCHSDWNAQNSPMLPTTIAMYSLKLILWE